ncbi:hypothetical protein PENTCL1PPCAC_10504, partial [Pristionchus entomophagus]
MAFRDSFWTLFFSYFLFSYLLFFRLYCIIFTKSKQPQYGSFFFKMFLTQLGDQFVLDVKILPHILYFWTFHYFVYSQIWSAVMISVNRYVVVCRPRSSLDKIYHKLSTPSLALINLIVSYMLCTRLFFQPPMYYYRSPVGVVQLNQDFAVVNVS